MIELAWNTYPSTVLSSLSLQATHLLLLCGLACAAAPATGGTRRAR